MVAKKRDSTYQPGRRSSSWIKDKIWNTQEVVIGGWREGDGGRSSGIGALLMGIPGDDGGCSSSAGSAPASPRRSWQAEEDADALHTDESPFDATLPKPDAKGVTFVRPSWSARSATASGPRDGRLRQPSWRGLRPDKTPDEVVKEGG